MPVHTHERRMEVYFYFNMAEDTIVFHFMGTPDETRHIIVRNEEALISPSWSIHSGAGTNNYTFIWGMVGENQTFTDMDHVDMKDLNKDKKMILDNFKLEGKVAIVTGCSTGLGQGICLGMAEAGAKSCRC